LDYYKIGQQIRKLRRAQGLSQEALAERIDISTTHMSHIETGSTKMSLQVLVDIARALDVRTDDILNPSAAKGAALEEVAAVFDSCTGKQSKVIADVACAVKKAMDKYL